MASTEDTENITTAESISSKKFCDLPMDIIRIVIKDLELIDKLSLRKVSKSLRSVVDGHKFESSSVRISFERDLSQIHLGKCDIWYSNENGKSTYEIWTWASDSDGGSRRMCNIKPRIIEEKHWESMIRDLPTFLSNPNWKFGNITWYFDLKRELTPPEVRQKQIQFIENMLKKAPLQVKSMSIYSREPTEVMAILPNVIPGSLEFLGLNSQDDGETLEEIVELEQWKRLKIAIVGTVPDSLPIEHFFHLENFRIGNIRITEDRLVKIRDILFKSSKFSYCSLTSAYEKLVDVDGNGEEITSLRALIIVVNRVMGEHPEYNADTRRYSLPGSDEHFTVYSSEWSEYEGVELQVKRRKNQQENIENSR